MPTKKVKPSFQQVNYEVQPANKKLNLDDVAKKLISEVKISGLEWANQYKKELDSAGVFKIVLRAMVKAEGSLLN